MTHADFPRRLDEALAQLQLMEAAESWKEMRRLQFKNRIYRVPRRITYHLGLSPMDGWIIDGNRYGAQELNDGSFRRKYAAIAADIFEAMEEDDYDDVVKWLHDVKFEPAKIPTPKPKEPDPSYALHA